MCALFARRKNRKRHRRWFAILFGLLLMLGTLAWFAPAIAVRTPVRNKLLAYVSQQLNGQVAVGDATLGWVSPVLLRNVVVFDPAGQPIVQVAEIRSDRTLLALVTERADQGVVRISQPQVHLITRPGGSNLEDVLAPLLDAEPTDADATAILNVRVEIVDGQVTLTDATTGQTNRLHNVDAQATVDSRQGMTVAAELSGTAETPRGSGSMAARGTWTAGESMSADVQARLQSLPLDAARPVLTRLSQAVSCDGMASGDVAITWNEAEQSLVADFANASLRNVDAAIPGIADPVRLARVNLNGVTRLAGNELTIKELIFESDLGRVSVNGMGNVETFQAEKLLASTIPPTADQWTVSGEIDLARLANMLPKTLQIQDATQLNSGRATVELNCRTTNGQRTWQGNIVTSDISAMNQGRPVAWRQPVRIDLLARQTSSGPVLDRLQCNASFLSLTASGTMSQAQATLRADLDDLVAQVGQFVDLKSLRLAGRIQADAKWQEDANQRFQTLCNATIKQFEFITPKTLPWRESELRIVSNAAGSRGNSSVGQLDSGHVTIEAGSDRLIAQLTRPVAALSAETLWPLRVQMIGSLADWLPRAQSLGVSWAGWNFGGSLNLDATTLARADGSVVELENASLNIDKAVIQGPGLNVQESRIEVKTAGAWSAPNRELKLKPSTVASTTVALATDEVVLRFGQGFHGTGNVGFRADLDRLTQLTGTSNPGDLRLLGSVEGQASLADDGKLTRAKLSAEIKDLVVAESLENAKTRELWKETKVTVNGNAGFEREQQTVMLDDLDMTAAIGSVRATGSISDLSRTCSLDLHGTHTIDLAQLAVALRIWLNEQVNITGRETQHFRLRGPLLASRSSDRPAGLVPESLTAETVIGWERAATHGFTVNRGSLPLYLAQGVVYAGPVDVAVNEGRLQASPRIDLNSTSLTLEMDQEALLQNVKLTPDMCRTWLKYVAPVVANATQIQGVVSVDLSGARVPLADASTSDIAGRVMLSDAYVGPGPFSQQFIDMATEVKSIVERRPFTPGGSANQWVAIPRQNIDFAVQKGRVFHSNVQVAIKDVVVQTQGSVGFDQTVSINAQVPVRDQWVSGNELLAALKGQVIEIPVSGTLTNPKLDRRAVKQLTGQVLKNAAGNLLQDQINRGLNRLFGQ